MRRRTLVGLGFLFAGGLSCYDARSALGPDPQATREVTAADACVAPDRAGIEALVNEAFNDGSPGPSLTSLTGGNLNGLFDATPGTPEASAEAAKVIQKIQQLAGIPSRVKSTEKVTELTAAVLCVAGFDLDVDGGDDVIVVEPKDEKQTFKNSDETFGFIIPVGGLNGPEVIVIEKLNTAILNTPLDVHPLYFRLERSGTGNFPVPWVISLCPNGAPDEAYQYLAVGHEHNGVFKLLEKPEEGVELICETDSSGPSSARFSREGGAALNVTTFATRGPVSGSTGTFSTVSTVDRRGTTSGSTATFSRDGGARLSIMSIGTTSTCTGPFIAGQPVPAECRPSLTLTTPEGNPLTNLNVKFDMTAGNGTVANGNGGTCTGSFGSTVTVPTDAGANAQACWNLGNVGTNTVLGTPQPLYDGMIFGHFVNGVFEAKAVWGWTYTASPIVSFPTQKTQWLVDESVDPTCTYNGTATPNPCNPISLSAVSPLTGASGSFPAIGLIFAQTNVLTPVASGPSFTFYVAMTYGSLCNVSRNTAVVTDPKLGQSLCAKLESAAASDAKGDQRGKNKSLDGYISQVQTQTGKHITPFYATHLIRWANVCKAQTSCINPVWPTTASASISSGGTIQSRPTQPVSRTGPATRR